MSEWRSVAGSVDPRLRAASFGDRVRFDAPIGELTTYRVGGRAAALVVLETESEITELARIVSDGALPTLVIGRGSNLLIADSGFDGVAVMLGEGFSRVEIEGGSVRAGGSVKLPVLARATVAAELTGLEWAVGVPGSVGGAVRMNAGGHGSDMSQSLVSATVADLNTGIVETIDASRLRLGYRTSSIGGSQIVVSTEFSLSPGDSEQGRRTMVDIVQWRRANQPGGQNAGSVFTNPPGQSAGRLIEEAGAKGLRIGSAEVSSRHANFIQADEGGSAADVFALMREVRRMVHEVHGVELQPETRLVGFHGPLPSGN